MPVRKLKGNKMSIKEWLRKTRSLRHDIYEAVMWIVGISLVIYYFIR